MRNNRLNTWIRLCIPHRHVAAVEPSWDDVHRDILSRLQWSSWTELARNSGGPPWVKLSIDVQQALGAAWLPAAGISVELSLGLTLGHAVGVGLSICDFGWKEEGTLACPVFCVYVAGDDGFGSCWCTAMKC